MNGLDVLRRVRTMDAPPQVVVISGHGTVETAVKATKLGAFDFLEKPLTLEKVVLTVKNALRQQRLEEENLQLREKTRARTHLVGKSPAIVRLREEIKKAAPTDGRVLLTGENGTGKELIARIIHDQSRRARQALRRDQLRRHPRRADRGGALRHHQGRRRPTPSRTRRASSCRPTAAPCSWTKSGT